MSVASDWKSVNPSEARFSCVDERKGRKVERGASEASEGNMYHRYINPSHNHHSGHSGHVRHCSVILCSSSLAFLSCINSSGFSPISLTKPSLPSNSPIATHCLYDRLKVTPFSNLMPSHIHVVIGHMIIASLMLIAEQITSTFCVTCNMMYCLLIK